MSRLEASSTGPRPPCNERGGREGWSVETVDQSRRLAEQDHWLIEAAADKTAADDLDLRLRRAPMPAAEALVVARSRVVRKRFAPPSCGRGEGTARKLL